MPGTLRAYGTVPEGRGTAQRRRDLKAPSSCFAPSVRRPIGQQVAQALPVISDGGALGPFVVPGAPWSLQGRFGRSDKVCCGSARAIARGNLKVCAWPCRYCRRCARENGVRRARCKGACPAGVRVQIAWVSPAGSSVAVAHRKHQ